MSYYIIIRGPLGCGKTIISKKLAKTINAKYLGVDRVLDEHKLISDKEDGYISQKSFKKVNEIIAGDAVDILRNGQPIVFDGNFYWKSQIHDLINRLDFPRYVFTLKAPVEICIERDAKRENTHGKDAAIVVHKKSTQFSYGIEIDVTKPIGETTKEILSKISELNSDKPKVLCVCAVGVNRSEYLAKYLHEKGYQTKWGGVDYREEGTYNPLSQESVDWADIIVIVRKRLEKIFKQEFNPKGKRIITLDVSDQKKYLPKESGQLAQLEGDEFQNKWTYPALREAMESYLPLFK
ncbi:AAA family ATPase [Patescibacteria group bacterium]|nr:AAA family ATPase [Patescibacteria group bacterium]